MTVNTVGFSDLKKMLCAKAQACVNCCKPKAEHIVANEMGWSKTKLSHFLHDTGKNDTGYAYKLENIHEFASYFGIDAGYFISPDVSVEQIQSLVRAKVRNSDTVVENIKSANVHKMLEDVRNNFTSSVTDEDTLIFDPRHWCFHGYVDSHPTDYYFYTKPTIPKESDKYLKGILRLSISSKDENDKYCKAELDIDTGVEHPITDSDRHKIYTGQMAISLKMQCAYIILGSPKTGEINLITFIWKDRNTRLFSQQVAACQTVSAGEHHRPTMEIAIISRKELNDEELTHLEGLLFVQDLKSLLIPADRFDEKFESKIKNVNIKPQLYYELNDGNLQEILNNISSDGQTNIDDTTLLLDILAMSRSPACIRIRQSANDLLESYIETKQKAAT